MSPTLDYVLADVFTDRAFGGNPLAVFPDAAGLSTEAMQAIARELNLSEATFVSPPPSGAEGYTVRIFTPLLELPFAGHPTIGTALVLDAASPEATATQGERLMLLHEPIGIVPVRISPAAGRPRAVLTSPKIPETVSDAPDPALLARLLNLDAADVLTGPVAPACFSAGVPFTFIPLKSRAALSRIRLDGAVWQAHLAQSPGPHIYALVMEDWRSGRTIDARMFAPAMGIAEDPATGVAAAALAGYLASFQVFANGEHAFTIRQGTDMGRPSIVELSVDVTNARLAAVHVGGGAVVVGRGAILREALRGLPAL